MANTTPTFSDLLNSSEFTGMNPQVRAQIEKAQAEMEKSTNNSPENKGKRKRSSRKKKSDTSISLGDVITSAENTNMNPQVRAQIEKAQDEIRKSLPKKEYIENQSDNNFNFKSTAKQSPGLFRRIGTGLESAGTNTFNKMFPRMGKVIDFIEQEHNRRKLSGKSQANDSKVIPTSELLSNINENQAKTNQLLQNLNGEQQSPGLFRRIGTGLESAGTNTFNKMFPRMGNMIDVNAGPKKQDKQSIESVKLNQKQGIRSSTLLRNINRNQIKTNKLLQAILNVTTKDEKAVVSLSSSQKESDSEGKKKSGMKGMLGMLGLAAVGGLAGLALSGGSAQASTTTQDNNAGDEPPAPLPIIPNTTPSEEPIPDLNIPPPPPMPHPMSSGPDILPHARVPTSSGPEIVDQPSISSMSPPPLQSQSSGAPPPLQSQSSGSQVSGSPPPPLQGSESSSGGGQLMKPTAGKITSGFGKRAMGDHKGIDFGIPIGSPVAAAQSGTVTEARTSQSYGNMIKIRGNDGLETLYAHLSSFNVQQGQQVEKGQTIALSGNTGFSTGPHLHFEAIKDGTKVDPAPLLGASGQVPPDATSAPTEEMSKPSAVPATPTSGTEVAKASTKDETESRSQVAMASQGAASSTQSTQSSTSPRQQSSVSVIDPNDPGRVEPSDADERYMTLFGIAA